MSDRQDTDMNRAAEIFERASQLEHTERGAYLTRTCAGDSKLRAEIESMLAARSGQGEFLDEPTLLEPVEDSTASVEEPGTLIGRYKLLQRIGEGGFGSVYMAEQREPIKRKVALKIIKLGMDTKQVIARFDAERQALAMMDHSNIARVFDAGATEAGRPYFVMELVKGVPITEYCDVENLTTGERLDLFIDVCGAVQHAHQKGIIHRDIKPSNVLVTLHDGRPVPKVIDFGIAKATNAELTEKTLFTEYRQMIGTPAYMSPEQAEMSGLDLDTRSDIYSLGVLLYELLTGNTPFDAKRFRTAALGEIQRIIREEEPPRPSARISSLSGPSAEASESADRQSGEYVARHRRTDLTNLARRLRGDLDWIVMRALEKDRTRRYETAAGLAEDIHRHRTNQPVTARPPSQGYRLQTFVRRNRLGVSAAVIIVLSLVGGLTLATIGMLRARTAEKRVTEEAARTRTLADFYASVFMSVNPIGAAPSAPPAMDVTILDVLKSASERVGPAFEGRPVLEAEVRKTLAESFFGLGSKDRAMELSEQALALETEALGPDHPTTLQTGLMVGATFWIGGDYKRAKQIIRPRLDRAEEILGADDPIVLRSMCLLTNCLTKLGLLEEAEPYAHKAVQRMRAAFGESHPGFVGAQVDLAGVLIERGRFEESAELMRDVTGRLQAGEARAVPMMALLAQDKLATALAERGQFEEAGRAFDGLVATARQMLGDSHPWTHAIESSRSVLLYASGELVEAERVLDRILVAQRAYLEPDTLHETFTVLRLLPVLIERGRVAEAERMGHQAIERSGPDTPASEVATMYVGWALLERGESAEAERVLAAGLDDLEQRYPGGYGRLPSFRRMYGRSLTAVGRFDEAEEQLLRSFESQLEMRGRGNHVTRLGAAALHELYTAWGKPDAAAEYGELGGA